MPSFEKSPPALIERFGAVVAGFPDVTARKMFGYPAAFVGGNMVSSLFGDRWLVRLAPEELPDALALEGGGAFEPMPGKPMRGYALLPRDVADDPEAASAWVARAIAFGATLPPKPLR